MVGKGENAGHQHFLLFPHDFKIVLFTVIKIQECVANN